MYRYSSNPGISELPKSEMLLILRRRFDGTNVLPALDLAGKPRCEFSCRDADRGAAETSQEPSRRESRNCELELVVMMVDRVVVMVM